MLCGFSFKMCPEWKLVQPFWRTVWSFLNKPKVGYHVTLQSHSWAHIWRKMQLEKIHAPCSQQHCSQEPRHGSNRDDHLVTKMNGQVRRGTHIQGNTWLSPVTQSCPTLGDPMNRSTPGLPVHHQLPEFTQTHVH